VASGGAVALAGLATPRLRLSRASLGAGLLALIGWALFAALGPTLLGIDHRGLLDIQAAGDPTALHKGFGSYPLRTLAPIAAGAGVLALAGAYLARRAPASVTAAPSLQAAGG
jgi:hypothetical protein